MRRDERGAIAAMTALMLVLVISSAAFAVDLGMQRVVRSDVQALADMVALDAARLLDGRTAGEIRAGSAGRASLADAVAASVARNTSTLGRVDGVTPTLVFLSTDANGALVPSRLNGALVPVPDSAVPDAVLVEADGSVDFAFAPGRGGAGRSALADATPYACFKLGSYAAALDTGDSGVSAVFESVVGDALGLNLHAIGYQGLATSSIDLGLLATQLGVGSVSELATLDAQSVQGLFSAGAAVLDEQGDTAAAATLADIATRVSSGLHLDVGDILSVGDGSATSATINALDLVGAAALGVSADVANGNNFLDTGVPWSAPHVSNGDIELKVVEAPQQACGQPGPSTEAHTAQLQLTSTTGFNLPNTVDGLSVSTQGDLTSKAGTLAISASLAGAKGYLTDMTCSNDASSYEDISALISTALIGTAPTSASVSLPYRLTGTIDAAGIVPASLVPTGLGTISSTKVSLDLFMSTAATTTPAQVNGTTPTTYAVPPHDYTDPQASQGSSSYLSVPSATTSVDLTRSTATLKVTATLLGITTTTSVALSVGALNLGSVISAVDASVIGTSTATVIGNVNSALVPVAELLGLRIAGADMFGVPHPSCSTPELVG